MSGLFPQHGEILLYDNGTDKQFVSVVFKDETFWLTQSGMAELFDCSADNISLHLKNIYADGELEQAATTEKFSVVRKEGSREVRRSIDHYDLDAIIAVGYRVNSKKATHFRQWATKTLKEYIQKGFVLNDELMKNGRPFGKDYFDELLERCSIPRPEGRTVFTLEEALQAAQEVGYPVLMRPSYVLGGQNMIVAYNSADVTEYMGVITKHVDMSHPVLMDKYILGTECEVDAICDGTDYLVPGIMQQVERTGVHSGDSICVYPPYTFSQKVIDTLVDYTGRFARELKVVGLVNVQYAVQNDHVYVIEVNPRSSRTVPYISKVTGVPMVDLAVRCTLGEKLKDMGYGTGLWRNGNSPYYAVKVPVYSFLKLHGVDTMLGPEMKSTGEVLGIAPTFHEAMMKGLVAAGYQFKVPGPGSCCIVSVKDSDKPEAAELAWKLHDYGYKIYGTAETARYLNSQMIPCSVVRQMSGARPNMIDLLESGLVDYIISTSPHGRDPHRDSVKFRRKATELSIPCITAMDTARVLVDALRGDHDISQMELVDIAHLHREAAKGE